MYWQTSRRKLVFDHTLVMAILNVTPDSFSDGGTYLTVDEALRQVEQMAAEGADILDIGGESTRPGSQTVTADEEIRRTEATIAAISKRFELPISIDTTKADVARRALDAGAEIINDISGLRFDDRLADIAADTGAGLVLMHSLGQFETMHKQAPVGNVLLEVVSGFRTAVSLATTRGVAADQIVLDPGLGFGKSFEQNLELLARLDKIVSEFKDHAILVGASRKSFIGRVVGGVPPSQRLGGSVAAALAAADHGARIVRVHDVRSTVQALRVAAAIKNNENT